MKTVVIGTRKSNLALKQAEWVKQKLEGLGLPYRFELKKIVTRGDQILDVTLSKVGGKALFVKEIEKALENGEIDLAVHSMKDIPSEIPDGFAIGAVSEREDPRDALISESGHTLHELPAGSIIGTSSLRRQAQILAARPDVEVKWIRGNIETRMRKMKEEDFDAIVLAAAGLSRMGWSDEVVTEYLHPEDSLPSVGQGALGIECRAEDNDILQLLTHIHDERVARTVQAERAFLKNVEGSCQVPVAGHATLLEGNDISLRALVASPDGRTLLQDEVTGVDPEHIGKTVAANLLERGGKEILDQVKRELEE
ncbi:hydroxymethylbilane synthase [Natribacillus halophilus]|uniref:Porphobilinogen deaminase n=1 Tax=Natribacillus halophilus TaxID=549003 RepID=A0A1G8LS97_9BACI|nr:hydroxymethylbilane synthase [Natribacillus halophilus]SDI58558.1 hydroxymethylbilane synthase [Natribacillus halophilus]